MLAYVNKFIYKAGEMKQGYSYNYKEAAVIHISQDHGIIDHFCSLDMFLSLFIYVCRTSSLLLIPHGPRMFYETS